MILFPHYFIRGTTINPKRETSFATFMTEGDPYCEIVFEEGEG